MRRVFIVTCIVLCIALAGCAHDPPVYVQQNYSLPGPVETALKCDISGTTFYQKSVFIYHVTDIDDRVVYSPVGTYTKPRDYPRWQLRVYGDRDDSLYTKTLGYIGNRSLPNGENVTCEEVTELPSVFAAFIRDHEALFKQNLYTGSEDIEL